MQFSNVCVNEFCLTRPELRTGYVTATVDLQNLERTNNARLATQSHLLTSRTIQTELFVRLKLHNIDMS